jgi:flagellar hook assembly protein FlgD
MAQELLDQAYKQLGLKKSAVLPKAFSLSQNYPNPFNPSTTINYDVPEEEGQIQVTLSVYNIRGQLVKTLVDVSQGPGSYNVNWDGTDREGRKISSGVFFYRLVAGNYVSTRKMVVLK